VHLVISKVDSKTDFLRHSASLLGVVLGSEGQLEIGVAQAVFKDSRQDAVGVKLGLGEVGRVNAVGTTHREEALVGLNVVGEVSTSGQLGAQLVNVRGGDLVGLLRSLQSDDEVRLSIFSTGVEVRETLASDVVLDLTTDRQTIEANDTSALNRGRALGDINSQAGGEVLLSIVDLHLACWLFVSTDFDGETLGEAVGLHAVLGGASGMEFSLKETNVGLLVGGLDVAGKLSASLANDFSGRLESHPIGSGGLELELLLVLELLLEQISQSLTELLEKRGDKFGGHL